MPLRIWLHRLSSLLRRNHVEDPATADPLAALKTDCFIMFP